MNTKNTSPRRRQSERKSSTIRFVLNGEPCSIDCARDSLSPTTTVLQYLRASPTLRGTKEGCAEGDCGACTVVLGERAAAGRIEYRAVDSCLVFLPMLHGKHLVTVESLAPARAELEALHPVQREMVECHGSQCGYCTPGFVMSLLALYKSDAPVSRACVEESIAGNLCRCTGYRSIVEAGERACRERLPDCISESEERVAKMLDEIHVAGDSLEISSGGQKYHRPRKLEEACALLKAQPDALVICGATDVALRVTKRHEVLPTVLDLGAIESLREIHSRDGTLFLGAAAPLSRVLDASEPAFPALASMLKVFGSLQIRNLATLGGNLGTASPIGDTLPVLVAYDATIVLHSASGERRVPMREFVTGYRSTVRRADELVAGVELRAPAHIVRSYKVSKRRDLDISTASAGFSLKLAPDGTVADICLAYGGMAAQVKRASSAEGVLRGKPWDRAHVEAALPHVDRDFSPISDARSGAAARAVAARNLLLKFWDDTRGESREQAV